MLNLSWNTVKEVGSRWWTSGMKSECSGKMAWCRTGELYSEAEHGVLGGTTKNKKCIVLTRTGAFSLNLVAADCSENNRPLCEVNWFHLSKIALWNVFFRREPKFHAELTCIITVLQYLAVWMYFKHVQNILVKYEEKNNLGGCTNS
jgi:hypothetical protein